MSDELVLDLNQTITAAVNARIEAEVMKALSGDDTIGRFVTAALQQPVEVKDGRTYRTERVPFLTLTLRQAIQEATKAAVVRLVAEETPKIEDEIRKALRRDIPGIAAGLTEGVTKTVQRGYGINVDVAISRRVDE